MRVLIWGIDEGTYEREREKKIARTKMNHKVANDGVRPLWLVWEFSPHPSLSPPCPSLPLSQKSPLALQENIPIWLKDSSDTTLIHSTLDGIPNGLDPTAMPWTSSTFRWSLVSSFPHDTLARHLPASGRRHHIALGVGLFVVGFEKVGSGGTGASHCSP
jgi:hypothetical protein